MRAVENSNDKRIRCATHEVMQRCVKGCRRGSHSAGQSDPSGLAGIERCLSRHAMNASRAPQHASRASRRVSASCCAAIAHRPGRRVQNA